MSQCFTTDRQLAQYTAFLSPLTLLLHRVQSEILNDIVVVEYWID